MGNNFIITSDRNTIEELTKLGFKLVSIDSGNNYYTFLNDEKIKASFDDKTKIAFTNQLTF